MANNQNTIIALLIIVAVVYFASSGTKAISGGNNNSNACFYAPTLNVFAQYTDWSKVPVVPTGAATGANVYAKGATLALTQGSTAAGSPFAVTNGITCTGTYLVTAGDGLTTYYLNYTYVNMNGNESKSITLLTPKYSAATLKFTNAISTAPISTAAAIETGVTAGSTQTGAYMQLQAGQYQFGQQNDAWEFGYNGADITSIALPGAPQISTGLLPPYSFVTSNTNEHELALMGSQTSVVAFLLPPIYDYQFAGQTPSFNQQYVVPVITTGSTFATNEVIGVSICPSTDWFNTTSGVVSTGVYINGVTKAGLFSCVSGTNAIVLHI